MSSLLFPLGLRALLARLLSSRRDDLYATVTLEPGALWSHRMRSGGDTLTCHEGRVWLTREGDSADHVLKAGDSVSLGGAGLVVVQALRPARISLSPTRPRPCELSCVPQVATR